MKSFEIKSFLDEKAFKYESPSFIYDDPIQIPHKFSKKEELMNHEQIIHGKDLKYDCKECNKNFSNMEDMRTHLQREHSYKKDR